MEKEQSTHPCVARLADRIGMIILVDELLSKIPRTTLMSTAEATDMLLDIRYSLLDSSRVIVPGINSPKDDI